MIWSECSGYIFEDNFGSGPFNAFTFFYQLHCSPALWNLYVGEVSLLLHVEQRDAVGISKQQHSSSGVEDFFAVWKLDLLCQFAFQVLDDELKI